MKKLFYAIAALAVVASCAKVAEVETNVEPKEENNLVHMTIRAQAPQTKTFIDQTSAKTYQPGWNLGDQLAVFFDAVKDNKDAVLDNYGDTGKAAEFMGDVNIAKTDHTVYAFYPTTAVFEKGSTDKKVELQVASIQRPLANTFDPDADIAVGKALDINVSSETVVIDNMVFARPLSTVKVTINNANAGVEDDETIQGIVIYAEDSKLTGTLEWDFENEEAQVLAGESSVSAMLKDNPIDFGTPFFLLVNPTSITPSAEKPLIITIFTNAHTITKTITTFGKELAFPLGGISELNISTSGADVTESMIATRVKSPATLAAGDEVIIAAANYYNVLMSTEQKSNNRGQALAYLYDEETIFISNDEIQRFAVKSGSESSTFAFKGINGDDTVADKYIYAASSKSNHLKSQDSIDGNASFAVSFAADGKATMTAQGSNTRNILRYNDASELFSCYSSGQDDVAIYRYKVAGAVPPSYDFTSVAELNALITSTTAEEYSGILTSAVVSYAPDTKNAVIKDASGSILYYVNGGHGLLQGQTFSGELTVTAKLYNDASEITACDASFTGAQTTVDPVAMTLDQLVGNFSTYQNAYVTVSDLIVTSVDGKNVNVKNGNKTYLVYSNAGNATVQVNDIITAVGTVAHYGTNDQIKVWALDNISKTGAYIPPTHTVTFTQPSETGCSFTVSVGGSPIDSGDSVSEGATVTLNATAGAGYTFSSWTVTGASVSGNTPSATFVMGESNVSISATFEVGVEPTYATKTIDFESALSTYTDWSFNSIGTTNTAITAHGGSKYGSNINESGNGVASAEIKTTAKYAKPYHVKFYNSKVTTNTTASSWKVQVSTNGSSWTDVKTIDAKSMGKGNWVENTVDLSSYSDVYVRITYSGSTAIRTIDDIELKYQTN